MDGFSIYIHTYSYRPNTYGTVHLFQVQRIVYSRASIRSKGELWVSFSKQRKKTSKIVSEFHFALLKYLILLRSSIILFAGLIKRLGPNYTGEISWKRSFISTVRPFYPHESVTKTAAERQRNSKELRLRVSILKTRWRHDKTHVISLPEFSSTRKSNWPVIVAFLIPPAYNGWKTFHALSEWKLSFRISSAQCWRS